MKSRASYIWHQFGHSLLEIILSIAVVAILSSMAVPSFSGVMNKVSIDTTRLQLLEDIRLLRSYSRIQNTASYLCALNQDGLCVSQSSWDYGWRGFIDNNDSHYFDEGDEIVIEHRNSDPRKIDIIIHSRWKNIKIDQQGVIRSSGHFRICDPNNKGAQNMKVIRMNVHGRLDIEADMLSCT